MDQKLQVGQTVYVEPIGNMRRSSAGIREATITKIGNKYFELDQKHYGRFHIESLVQDGGQFIANYQCFRSMEAIERRDKEKELRDYLKGYFSPYKNCNLPLEKMQQIKSIIENP
jgi:hypothetical protein